MAQRLIGDEHRVGDHPHPSGGAPGAPALEPARPFEREGEEQQRQPERHHRLHERARQRRCVEAHGAPGHDQCAAANRERERHGCTRPTRDECGPRGQQVAGRHPEAELEEPKGRAHVEHPVETGEVAVGREHEVERDEGDDDRAGEKEGGTDSSQGDEQEREQQVVLDDQEHEPQRALGCELPLVTQDAGNEQQPGPDVAVRQRVGDELAGSIGNREDALPPVAPEADLAELDHLPERDQREAGERVGPAEPVGHEHAAQAPAQEPGGGSQVEVASQGGEGEREAAQDHEERHAQVSHAQHAMEDGFRGRDRVEAGDGIGHRMEPRRDRAHLERVHVGPEVVEDHPQDGEPAHHVDGDDARADAARSRRGRHAHRSVRRRRTTSTRASPASRVTASHARTWAVWKRVGHSNWARYSYRSCCPAV